MGTSDVVLDLGFAGRRRRGAAQALAPQWPQLASGVILTVARLSRLYLRSIGADDYPIKPITLDELAASPGGDAVPAGKPEPARHGPSGLPLLPCTKCTGRAKRWI